MVVKISASKTMLGVSSAVLTNASRSISIHGETRVARTINDDAPYSTLRASQNRIASPCGSSIWNTSSTIYIDWHASWGDGRGKNLGMDDQVLGDSWTHVVEHQNPMDEQA